MHGLLERLGFFLMADLDAGGGGGDTGGDVGGSGQEPGGGSPDAGDATPGAGSPGQHTGEPGWINQVPKSLRNETLGQYQTIGDFVEAFNSASADLAKIKEQHRVPIPGPDSSPEVFQEFREKLGIPEEASQYQLELPELPQGFEITEEELAGLKDLAFQAALTNAQAQKIIDWSTEQRQREVQQYNEEMKAKNKEVEDQLKEQYGPDWKTKLGEMWNFMERTPWSGLAESLKQDELGSHPELINMMLWLADNFAEGGIPQGGGPMGSGGRQRTDLTKLYNSDAMERVRREKQGVR